MAASTENIRDIQVPKSRDFISVMSLVNTSSHNNSEHISREHNTMLSPAASSSAGSLSPASVSPRVNLCDDLPPPGSHRILSTTPTEQGFVRHNQVSTVMLHGVAIVCLFIDGGERLCLAQISNTLLKRYSYNEIHNRRVALGITCVQCTPVQLEILRRAGAMPISSRRCGMISKREAQRLVKSFLEDASPPKLPEDFAFSVHHECGWGCRGEFIPSRYNSSRAKCIKCTFCNMYFSPNKFIFHFHRTPESKYSHPDAANFNSWRRHLKLCSDSDDEISHIWEDVKAMFNGGSRKRGLARHISSSSSSSSHKIQSASAPTNPKQMKFTPDDRNQTLSQMRPRGPPHYPQYPVFPMPNKLIPFRPPQGHQTFCMQHPYPPFNKIIPAADTRLMKAPVTNWGGTPDTMIPPYEMIWAKHLGLSPMESGMVLEPRLKSYETENAADSLNVQISPKSRHDEITSNSSPEKESSICDKVRLSAFRPVGNRMTHTQHEEVTERFDRMENSSPAINGEDDMDSEENVDVDTIDTDDRDSEENNNISAPKDNPQCDGMETEAMNTRFLKQNGSVHVNAVPTLHCHRPVLSYDTLEPGEVRPSGAMRINTAQTGEMWSNIKLSPASEAEDSIQKPKSEHVEVSDSRQAIIDKEELQNELRTEMKNRKKLEADCKSIKETFQEQVEREKQFREEMAKQLHIVREKLCKELDQERQVRFSLQQKLAEAHEAMEGISSQLKDSKSCSECHKYKEPLAPR